MMGFMGGTSGSLVSSRPLQGLEAKVTDMGSQACLRDAPPRRSRHQSSGGLPWLAPPMMSHVPREGLVPGVPGTHPPGLVFICPFGLINLNCEHSGLAEFSKSLPRTLGA